MHDCSLVARLHTKMGCSVIFAEMSVMNVWVVCDVVKENLVNACSYLMEYLVRDLGIRETSLCLFMSVAAMMMMSYRYMF